MHFPISHVLTEYFLVDHASTEFTELAEYLTRSHGATHSIKYNVSVNSKKVLHAKQSY